MIVVLLHGYSGSPKNFNLLKKDLQTKGFTVLSPTLPFHESAFSLARASWKDFYGWFVSYLKGKKDVVVIGYSLGAQLAMAVDSPAITGRVAITPPFKPKAPFSFSFLGVFAGWVVLPKFSTSEFKGLRAVPLRGLQIIKDGNGARKIREPPDVEIHLSCEFLTDIDNPQARVLKCSRKEHNPFKGKTYEQTKSIIVEYLFSLRKAKLDAVKQKQEKEKKINQKKNQETI